MPSDAAVVHVVDDDEAMRQSMAFLLRTANIQVQTYEAAADFLNALSQAKAGCVVTDVRKDGRNLSGKRHDQNAGGKSLRFGSDGTGWGLSSIKTQVVKGIFAFGSIGS